MDEKDNVKWLERSTIGAPRYIILLYILGIAIIGILIFVGFHIIGKYHVNAGHEIFRDILTVVLTIAGITAGIVGYGIYRKVSEHIESTMKKNIDEFTDYSYALYYLTAGHYYWLREEETKPDSSNKEEEIKPDSFNLDNAISNTLEAYEHVCQLDKSEERNIILKYKILNNLGYFYAARGNEEDIVLALNCATHIENRINTCDCLSIKEIDYLEDTSKYIRDKYSPDP